MSVIDILTRVDFICKEYDKYDIEKQRDSNISVDVEIEALLQVTLFKFVTKFMWESVP